MRIDRTNGRDRTDDLDRTSVGAILFLGVALALALPGVRVEAACEAGSSCDRSVSAVPSAAPPAPVCEVEQLRDRAGATDALLAQVRQFLASGHGSSEGAGLNSTGYNYRTSQAARIEAQLLRIQHERSMPRQ